jgi:hypothetical protein
MSHSSQEFGGLEQLLHFGNLRAAVSARPGAATGIEASLIFRAPRKAVCALPHIGKPR